MELARGGFAICVRLLSGTWPAWPICLAKLTEECKGEAEGGKWQRGDGGRVERGLGKGMFGAGFRFVRCRPSVK